MIEAYLKVHNDLDELRKKLEMVNGDIEKMQKIYADAEKDKLDTGPAQEVEVRLTNIKNGITAEIAMTEKILDDTHVQLQVAAAEADQAAASNALKEQYSDFKAILENLDRYEASAAAKSDGISPSSDKTSATIRTSNGRSVTVTAPAGVLYDGIPTPTHAPPNPNANTNAQTQAQGQGQGQAVGSLGLDVSTFRDLNLSGVFSPEAPDRAPSSFFPGIEGADELSVNETLTMTQGVYGDGVVCIYFLSPFFHVCSMFVLPWLHYFNKLDSIYVPSSFVLHVPQNNPKAEAAASLQRVKDMMSSADFVFGPEWVEKYYEDIIVKQIGPDIPPEEASKNAMAMLKMFHENRRLRLSPDAKQAYHNIPAPINKILPGTENPTTAFPILHDKKRCDHGKTSKDSLQVELYLRYHRYNLRFLPRVLAGPPLRLKAYVGILTPGFCSKSIENCEALHRQIVEEEIVRQNSKTKYTLKDL